MYTRKYILYIYTHHLLYFKRSINISQVYFPRTKTIHFQSLLRSIESSVSSRCNWRRSCAEPAVGNGRVEQEVFLNPPAKGGTPTIPFCPFHEGSFQANGVLTTKRFTGSCHSPGILDRPSCHHFYKAILKHTYIYSN